MSDARERAQRRELLVARSSVQRLEIAHDVGVLREAVQLPRATLALGAVALGMAGGGRVRRVLRIAALAMAAFGIARKWLRR